MSVVTALAKPRRIKASHRRRRRVASGHLLYILNNPLSGTDPTGYTSCNANGDAADCANAAGPGGEAKVYKQDAGSRIKTTVGSVKNNGDGSATFTNNAGDSKTIGGGNGGTNAQGTMGTSSRQNQTASAGEKNAASNASGSNGQGGNGSNPADRFLPAASSGIQLSAPGDDDELLFSNSEPAALTALKKKYPELERRMTSAWKNSFGSDRKENAVIGLESPDGTQMKFLQYSARWRYTPGLWGYKDVSRTGKEFIALLAQAGIPDSWTIRVMFHTHPFNKCFGLFSCAFNSEAGPAKGPSSADWGTALKYDRSIIHVVREIDEANYTPKNRAYKDYYYGKSAGF